MTLDQLQRHIRHGGTIPAGDGVIVLGSVPVRRLDPQPQVAWCLSYVPSDAAVQPGPGVIGPHPTWIRLGDRRGYRDSPPVAGVKLPKRDAVAAMFAFKRRIDDGWTPAPRPKRIKHGVTAWCPGWYID